MNALAKSSLLALLLPAILPLAWPPQGEPVRQSFPEFAGTLRGRVVDVDGKPLANLALTLFEGRDAELLFHAVATGRSADDGRFELRGADALAGHCIGVDLDGPRRQMRHVEVSLQSGRAVDLGDVALPATTKLRGTIVDEQGHGIGGARVRVLPPYERDMFALANWFLGPILGAGLHTARADDLVISSRGGRSSASPLSPIAREFFEHPPVPVATTAADGSFEVETSAPGEVLLLVDHPRYVATMGTALVERGAIAQADPITLAAGATIEGKIAGPGSAAGLFVWVGAFETKQRARTTVGRFAGVTGPDGHFSIGAVPEDAALVVAAARSRAGPFFLAGPFQSAPLDITLPASIDLFVDVVDSSDHPLPDAEVSLLDPASGELPEVTRLEPATQSAVTEHDGNVRVARGLSPTPVVVVARSAGRVTSSETVDLGDGTGSPRSVKLQLATARAFAIQVVDSTTKRPLKGASARLVVGDREWALPPTDEQKSATLTGLPLDFVADDAHAAATVFVFHPLALPAQVPCAKELATPSAGPIEIALEAARTLRGRVVVHGAPPTKPMLLRVAAYDLPRGTDFDLEPQRIARVAADGTFALSGLATGKRSFDLLVRAPQQALFDVRFYGPDGPRLFFEGELVVPEDPEREVTIDATPLGEREGIAIHGTIHRTGGSPSGLLVTAYTSGGELQATSSTDGAFAFTGIKGGRVSLEIADSNDKTYSKLATKEIELSAGGSAEVVIDLHSTPLDVSPRWPDGTPAWATHVSINRAEDRNYTQCWGDVGQDGLAHFELSGSEKWLVRVERFDEGHGRRNFTLPLDENPCVIPMVRCVPCAGRVEFDGDAPGGTVWQMYVGECAIAVDPRDRRFKAFDVVPGVHTARLDGAHWSARWSHEFQVDEVGSTDLVVRFKKDEH